MEFVVQRKELDRELRLLSAAMETKPTLPVLSNVFMAADAEGVSFQTTDLTMSMYSSALPSAVVVKSGAALLPAHTLSALVSRLPDGEVSIAATAKSALVTSGRSELRLPLASVDDYPPIPARQQPAFTLPAGELATMIRRVSHVMTDEVGYASKGARMDVGSDVVRLVALDGRQLAVTDYPYASVPDVGFTLAARTWSALRKWLDAEPVDESIAVAVKGNHAWLSSPSRWACCVVMATDYPNYSYPLTLQPTRTVTVSRDALLSALKRLTVLVLKDQFKARVSLLKGQMSCSIETTLGKSTEDVVIAGDGADIELGADATFLLGAVNAIDSESVGIAVVNDLTPFWLFPLETERPMKCVMRPGCACTATTGPS
jgi:DNA polymerase-3 subunit beta